MKAFWGSRATNTRFPIYLDAHVPVALSTDDEGVSRIDITHEYVRAALDYHLSYADMKSLARTGMEHSFLSGASLWARPDAFDASLACATAMCPVRRTRRRVQAFLDGSEKATAQWEQERRFLAFEAKW